MGVRKRNSTSYKHVDEPNLLNLHKAMDYDFSGQPVVRIDDTSLEHTSKNRAKVSNYEIVFFNTFQYDAEEDVWDEFTTPGGISIHEAEASQIVMEVDGSVPAAKVIRQTKNVLRYIPGRSIETTFAYVIFGPDPGICRRVGAFDEMNGIFLETFNNEVTFVIRSNASGTLQENRISQADWNQDRLLGDGNSGVTIDFTKRQMMVFEYEWYGVGLCELKFVIGGHTISAHKEFHANLQDLPWSGTPFVPLRAEIENVSATSGTYTLNQGSVSTLLEGVTSKVGVANSVASKITGTRIGTANNWYPVLSIRLKSGRLNGVVLPKAFQVATVDNTNLFYRLVRNATIGAGGDPWLPVPAGESSFTEYQTYTTPSSIPDIDQGLRLDTGFVIAGGGGTNIQLEPQTVYQIGRNQLGTVSDVFTILCSSNSTNKTAIAAMTWIEQR